MGGGYATQQAQVPMASTAAAPGAMRSSHSSEVIWRPVSGSSPRPHPVAVVTPTPSRHDRPLPADEVGGIQLAFGGQPEVLGPLPGPTRPTAPCATSSNTGQARHPAGEEVLDPGVGGTGDGDRATVARGTDDPEQVHLLERALGHPGLGLTPLGAAIGDRGERIVAVGDQRHGLDLTVGDSGNHLGVLRHRIPFRSSGRPRSVEGAWLLYPMKL